MAQSQLQRLSFAVGPLQCNCSVIYDEQSRDAIVIDPGDEAENILKKISDKNLNVKYAIHTHAHFDHCGATSQLKEKQESIKIALHKDDHELYVNLPMQGELFGFRFDIPKPVDKFLVDNEELVLGTTKFKIIHTPGHSPGGVCVHFDEGALSDVPVLFSGDTLFQHSIGRTDLWGGDFKLLLKSIRQRLFTLDDQTFVMPGHGPSTEIGREAHSNPFLTG